MSEDSPEPSKLAQYAALSQVGLEMVAPIGLGLLLDYWLAWGPWGASAGRFSDWWAGWLISWRFSTRDRRKESTKRRRDQQ